MATSDLSRTLGSLFDAERAVREAHVALLDAPPNELLAVLESAIREASKEEDEDERALQLVRVAGVLGELEGPKAVDLLIDVLGSEDPEARHAAGTSLEDIAYERFKEVALGVERAVERLPVGNLALTELPYLLQDIPEGGVLKLLGRFLAHKDPEAAAAGIEAIVEFGDPSALAMLAPLLEDKRTVHLEDDEGDEGNVTLGELAGEAQKLLSNLKDKG